MATERKPEKPQQSQEMEKDLIEALNTGGGRSATHRTTHTTPRWARIHSSHLSCKETEHLGKYICTQRQLQETLKSEKFVCYSL